MRREGEREGERGEKGKKMENLVRPREGERRGEDGELTDKHR